MMKNKKSKIQLIILLSILIILAVMIGIIPSINDYSSRHRIYQDLYARSSEIIDANINIINVTESKNETSYGVGASGVIISRSGHTYYALTAYHVIKTTAHTTYRIASPKTTSYAKASENTSGYLPLSTYYNALPKAKTVYTKEASDLAIISFQSDEDLPAVHLANRTSKKHDKIMVVSNYEGEKFQHTYGRMLSSKTQTTSFSDSQTENKVMRHNAYEAPGSSGSGVYNSSMKLAGINIGGATDVFGRFRYGYMIPIDQIKACIKEWKQQST